MSSSVLEGTVATERTAAHPSLERRRDRRIGAGPWISVVIMVGLTGLWQLGASAGWFDRALFSSPASVARAGWQLFREEDLLRDLRSTFISLVAAMAAAVVVGEILGLLLGRVERVRWMFEWLLVVLNSMPRLSFIPVLILAFGIGYSSKIAVGFLSAVVPIVLFVITGVRQVPTIFDQVTRSLGFSRLAVLRKVIVPASLPHLAGGTKLGFSRALIGIVIAEVLNPIVGLGRLIAVGRRSIDPSRLIFAALLIGVVGMLGVQLVSAVERRLVR